VYAVTESVERIADKRLNVEYADKRQGGPAALVPDVLRACTSI